MTKPLPTFTLLTTIEVAKILGVSRRRVLALITAGRLPATRVGHAWLVWPVDLALVKDRKPGTPVSTKRAKRK